MSTLLVCFAGLTALGQDSPLKVEIKPAQTAARNNERFSVATVIRNTGKIDQALAILDCCYAVLWVADSPSVHVDCSDACLQNSIYKIMLKPGDTYEKTVLVRVDLINDHAPKRRVTFRLGFRNDTDNTQLPNTRKIWSNAVTIKVTNDGSYRGAANAKTDLPADPGTGTGGVTITHVCETTTYQPPRPGVPFTWPTLLEGRSVSTASSPLAHNGTSHTYDGILTIKDVSSSRIAGPFLVVFDSLTEGVTLTDSTGSFGCWPYLAVPGVDSLKPGHSASVNLHFSNPKNETIKYVPLIYYGKL